MVVLLGVFGGSASGADSRVSRDQSVGELAAGQELFRSEEDITAELVKEIPWENWNESRKDLGMAPLERVEGKAALQLVETYQFWGVPLLPSEVALHADLMARNEALLDFFATVSERERPVDSWMDEPKGKLDVWVKDVDALKLAAPDGVTMHSTGFSFGEIEQYLATPEFAEFLAATGRKLSGREIGNAGLTVFLEATKQELADVEALGRELSASAPASKLIPVRVEVREPIAGSLDHCDGLRVRCDVPVGGMEWVDSCSSGFVVRNTDGRRGVSTAGHCSNTNGFPVRGPDTFGAGNFATVGLLFEGIWDEDFDMKIGYSLPSAQAGGFAPVYNMDSIFSNRPISVITTSPPENLRVCLSSRNAVTRRCGVIVDNNWDLPNNTQGQPDFTNGLRIFWWGGQADTGDSGGALTSRYFPYRAVGTHVGHCTDGACVPDGFSYPASKIPQHLSDWSVALSGDYWAGLQHHFVARTYQSAANEFPTMSTVDTWIGAMQTGCEIDAKTIVRSLLYNQTAALIPGMLDPDRRRRVRRLYWTAFNRAPDNNGLDHWVGEFNDTAGWQTVVEVFLAHPEFEATVTSTVGRNRGPCQ